MGAGVAEALGRADLGGWFALPGFVPTGRWASRCETLLSGSLIYRFPFFNLGRVDLKNIHNPKVESFMLFSGNF